MRLRTGGCVTNHTFETLMRRLSRAGFKKDFAHVAILPDWWDETCAQEPNLLPEVETRIARFLGAPVSVVRDANANLVAPIYQGAQLRRVRDINRDRLAPAIHAAMRIAEAVVRSLRPDVPAPGTPQADALLWRQRIASQGGLVTLDRIVAGLWGHGIPVIAVEALPAPAFQGAAFVVQGRPVIVVGHKHDEPGRVALLLAHETGHLAAGDCRENQPVVDEEDEVLDDDEVEKKADEYARRVLVGAESVPSVAGESFKQLATNALQIERSTGADASTVIFAWAAQTGDYATASMAVKALYRGSGAKRSLQDHLEKHVDTEAATESDRALLRCVRGDLADATAG